MGYNEDGLAVQKQIANSFLVSYLLDTSKVVLSIVSVDLSYLNVINTAFFTY